MGDIITASAKRSSSPKKARKSPAAIEQPEVVSHGSSSAPIAAASVTTGTLAIQAPKTDRKEYLRLKAIERRAATKAGLSVKACKLATEERTMNLNDDDRIAMRYRALELSLSIDDALIRCDQPPLAKGETGVTGTLERAEKFYEWLIKVAENTTAS